MSATEYNSAPEVTEVQAGDELFGVRAGSLVQYPVDLMTEGAKGFVNHGSDPNVARPTRFASVEWYGSVEPANGVAGDTWVETA
jgi:hypothetical protein